MVIRNNQKIFSLMAVVWGIAMILAFVSAGKAYAQDIRDEKQEEAMREVTEKLTPMEEEEKAKSRVARRLVPSLRIAYGYDTNPKVSPLRKGDHFEKFRFNLNYRRTFKGRNQLLVSSDANILNNHEFTDLNNFLGHTQIEYKLALTKQFVFGTGYDLSIADYPLNNQSDYTFHKVFTNVQYRVTKNLYHQLQFDHGWKFFWKARALSHSSASSYQDTERDDTRDELKYTLGYTINERFSGTLSGSFSSNDSNAEYQDYNDYDSFEVTSRISYKISEKVSSNGTFTFTDKNYDSRNVSNSNYKQEDRTYVGKIGFGYKLSNSSALSLDYTYRQNESNDLLSHYTASTIEAGWRYQF